MGRGRGGGGVGLRFALPGLWFALILLGRLLGRFVAGRLAGEGGVDFLEGLVVVAVIEEDIGVGGGLALIVELVGPGSHQTWAKVPSLKVKVGMKNSPTSTNSNLMMVLPTNCWL